MFLSLLSVQIIGKINKGFFINLGSLFVCCLAHIILVFCMFSSLKIVLLSPDVFWPLGQGHSSSCNQLCFSRPSIRNTWISKSQSNIKTFPREVRHPEAVKETSEGLDHVKMKSFTSAKSQKQIQKRKPTAERPILSTHPIVHTEQAPPNSKNEQKGRKMGNWGSQTGRERNARLSSNSLFLVKSENKSLAKNKIYWRLKWHFCRKWKHYQHGSRWLGVLWGCSGAMGRPPGAVDSSIGVVVWTLSRVPAGGGSPVAWALPLKHRQRMMHLVDSPQIWGLFKTVFSVSLVVYG